MHSFVEALEKWLGEVRPLGVENCLLEHAAGRVLRVAIRADREVPAYARVMMDGYALRVADWQAGRRSFQIAGVAPAGRAAITLSPTAGTCVEVMTGAPCPLGADGIVPVEEVQAIENGEVRFHETANPVAGRFIHRAGSDAAAGEILLEPGRVLGSREIGVAASCGAAVLEVSRLPKIAVMATGDELVVVNAVPEPHQIRQSNAHSLAAALSLAGYAPQTVGVLGDELAAARAAVEALLAEHDWIVLTGAVSKGARDFVPGLLADLGCRKIFHGVAQRPGLPAGGWVGPDGQMILALPGNPVSALTGLHTFLLPALAAASGKFPQTVRLVSLANASQLAFPEHTRHLPVKCLAGGQLEPATTGNSGDFIGLLRSDGFLTLPPLGAGESFPYTPWF